MRELQQTLLPPATTVASEVGFICFLCWCSCLFHGCNEFLDLFFLCPIKTDEFVRLFLSLGEGALVFIRPTLCEGRASLCHIGSEHHTELKCLNHMREKDEGASAANLCSKQVVATLDFVP